MAFKLTPDQEQAAHDYNHTVLLSAAAGSGKTKVLTERIIYAITEKNYSLKDILAVTFTIAATKEMKERIEASLKVALRNAKDKARLKKECALLPSSHIMTIDAFFFYIVKKYGGKNEIPDHFRVMDQFESGVLIPKKLERTMEKASEGQIEDLDAQDYMDFINNLDMMKPDTSILKELEGIYNKTCSYKEGILYFKKFEELYLEDSKCSLEQTNIWNSLLKQKNEMVASFINKIEKIEQEHNAQIETILKTNLRLKTKREFLEYLRSVQNANTLKEFQALLLDSRLKTLDIRNITDEITLEYIQLQKFAVQKIKEKLGEYTNYREEDWKYAAKEMAKECHVLYYLFSEFENEFYKTCERKHAYTFSQITRFAYEIVIQDGQKTDIAREIAQEYKMICIDEYQDVNPIQHAIFEAISLETNRFMVGDIKQAIYQFRGTDPRVFANLRSSYTKVEDINEDTKQVSRYLQQNFRSDQSILDFSNTIFSSLFQLGGESIHYDDAKDQLMPHQDTKKGVPPEIYLFTKIEGEKEREIQWGAGKIFELIEEGKKSGSGISAKDIVILSRKANILIPYGAALSSYGIRIKSPEAKQLFLNPEILLVVSLLNTINNPLQDIYLTAVLRSPLYQLSADELIQICQEHKKDSYFFEKLLVFHTNHPENEKVNRFLKQLKRFQLFSERIPVLELMEMIYKETSILSCSGFENENAQANLKVLYNYAKTYQGAEYEGLLGFLEFINKEVEQNDSIKVQTTTTDNDAVTIMTIHKSKGLEAPIVFLVNIGENYNQKDHGKCYLCDYENGFCTYYEDEHKDIKQRGPFKEILWESIYQKQKEEELRVLYVAITRAKNRLFITGTFPKITENLLKEIKVKSCYADTYSLFSLESYLQLLLFVNEIKPNTLKISYDPEILEPQEEVSLEEVKCDDNNLDKSFYIHCFQDTYQYPVCTRVNSKLTFSKMEDMLNGTLPKKNVYQGKKKEIKPNLYFEVVEPKATERGSATHEFMQYTKLERFQKTSVDEELDQMVLEGGFIKRKIPLLRKDELELFRTSTLIEKMIHAKVLKREYRFSLNMDATIFARTKEQYDELKNEKFFVQGVIDCFFQNEKGEISVIDYKTDRLSKEELEDNTILNEHMKSEHGEQVYYYSKAIEYVYGIKPKDIYIYCMQNGALVRVDPDVWSSEHIYQET